MPTNRQLEWVEIRDFAPGLFTVADWLIPSHGSQLMEDCFPQVGGGLRAFVKPETVTTSGLSDIANEAVVGCFVHYPGYRHGVGNKPDYFLAMRNITDNRIRIYRLDTSDDATSWVQVGTAMAAPSSLATRPNPVQFALFKDGSGDLWVVFNIYHVSSDDGLYAIDWSQTGGSQVWTKLAPTGPTSGEAIAGPLAVHDDRIYVGAIPNVVWYSDSMSTSFQASNFLPLNASVTGNSLMSIVPFAPSDLLVGFSASPWNMVQGDITDPIVRSMSPARTPGGFQQQTFTTEGIAFIGRYRGVFITSTGETFADISPQLTPSTWAQAGADNDVGIGDLGYEGDFLFAPHGLVFDFRTKSWFTSSFLTAGSGSFRTTVDHNTKHLLTALADKNPTLYLFGLEESSLDRCESYKWKSAPLRRPDGRQVEVREVQVYARGYHADSTVTVKVGAKTKTLTVGAAKQMLSFLSKERGEVLDVEVDTASNSSGVEAPSIEVVRIGFGPGHQIY